MSEFQAPRHEPERVARVWQPIDFFKPDGPVERFAPTRWREEAPTRFEPAPVLHGDEPVPQSFPDEAAPEPLSAGDTPSPPTQAACGLSQQALEEARLEAYARGLAHGRREAQEDQHEARQASHAAVQQRLDALQAELQALRQRPEQLHEPLKRLALHLAEQLVLGELGIAPQAIERLVRRCVDELAGARDAPVRIELHPDDLALLRPWLDRQPAEEGRDPPAWQLQASDVLRPGSVRASADDAVVSDLIEHRLDALARQLLLPAATVARQSAFQPERLAARRAEVDVVLDAQPRMADAPRSARFQPVVEAEATVADPADPRPPGPPEGAA